MTQPTSEQPPSSQSGRSALEVAVDAAHLSGRILLDRRSTSKQVSFKGRADIVTDVDLAAEKAVLDLLRGEYPKFGILAEESQPVETASPYTWVVDPLDGTRNYANGIPHFCTVIALFYEDQPIVGVTYDPVRGELFTAQSGQGAFLNGDPLSVSENRELSPVVVGL